MEWVETTGRTLEEARDKALDMLGVAESDAEFVTLSEPKPGLFGRMRGEARVRARVLPTTPPPKRTRGRRPVPKREGSGQRSGEATPTATKTAGSAAAKVEGSVSGATRSRSRNRRRRPAGTASGETTGATAEDGLDIDGSESNGTRQAIPKSNGNGEASASGNQRSRTRKKSNAESSTEEDAVTETLSLQEQGDLAKRFIEGLVAELGLEATVTAAPLNEEAVQVAVDGSELGLLVGKGGATLSAIQELARTVVQRKTGGHTDRILVDVAGYRARRTEALSRLTRQVVEDVVASGKEKAFEPMPPADRKVIHDAVNEIGGAATRSEGIEPRRYVVISPITSASPESDGAEPESDGAESDESVSEEES
jgi:spoIIIJ-associated protein